MPNRKDELRKRLLALIEDVHRKVMYAKEGLPRGDDEFFMRSITLANFMEKQAGRIKEHAERLEWETTKLSTPKED